MERKKRMAKYIVQPPMVCRVCGDIARGFNFNLITCTSCRTFFRRNAYRRMYMVQCQFNKECHITKNTRSCCSTCRLEKCFAEGMDPLIIRSIPQYSPGFKKNPKPKIKEEKLLQVSTPSTLDLLQNDRSTLTNDQWNFISNIIHAYDEQNSIVQIKYLINQTCSLPLKLRLKLLQTTDIIGHSFSSVQTLIERSSHIQSLPIDARRTLIKHNIYMTGAFNALFLFRELDLYNNLIVMNALNGLYGYNVAMTCVQNSKEYDQNGNLIKILIFLLVFSSNCSVVTFDDQEDIRTMSSSIHRIKIQDVYVTAFWKYLVYLYGFDEAVVRFSSLVKRILNLLHMAEMISNNATHNQMVDKIVTQTERSLVIRN